MKFYNMSQLIKQNNDVNFIIGGRCSGKSYQMAYELFKRYWKDRTQFVRAARSWSYVIGIGSYFDQILSDLLSLSLPERYYTELGDEWEQFYLGNSDAPDVSIKFNHNEYTIEIDDESDILGYVIPLTTEHTKKSNQYPRVTTLLLEEFVAPTPLDYADGSFEAEIQHLLSLISTVFRKREGQLFFVGNNLDISNPYFEYFGVLPADLRLGQITVYHPKYDFNGKPMKGATVGVEFVPIGWDDPEEIPQLLRLPGNNIATSGDNARSKYVYEDAITFLKLQGHIIGFDVNPALDLYCPLIATWYHYRGEPISYVTREKKMDDKFRAYLTLVDYNGDCFVAEIPDVEKCVELTEYFEMTPELEKYLDLYHHYQIELPTLLQYFGVYPMDYKFQANNTNGDLATLWNTAIRCVYYNDQLSEYDYMTDRIECVQRQRSVSQLGFGSCPKTEDVKDYEAYMSYNERAGWKKRTRESMLDTRYYKEEMNRLGSTSRGLLNFGE